MSYLTHVRLRGKDYKVTAVHRTVFRTRYPKEYSALEETEISIPDTLHVSSDMKKLFVMDYGLVPAVYVWSGKSWIPVKR